MGKSFEDISLTPRHLKEQMLSINSSVTQCASYEILSKHFVVLGIEGGSKEPSPAEDATGSDDGSDVYVNEQEPASAFRNF